MLTPVNLERLLVTFALVACHRASGDRATGDPPHVLLEAASATNVAASASTASRVRDAGPPAQIVWRVLDHKYVEDDAGRPLEMWVNVQLEVAGKLFGPWRFGAPSCALERQAGKHTVSKLSCYYAGGGDYVEIRGEKPGEYVVVTYAQDEGWADEPAPKTNTKIVARIQTSSLVYDAIVAADGGSYSESER